MTEPELSLPEHSIFYEQYFSVLNEEIHTLYAIAETARLQGFDPTTKVEIPPAHDVAARVEATLEGPVGVAKRIRELQEDKSREEVAFAVAKEIAEGKLGGIEDAEKAADKAVRVALSILTESITAAPLEGISKVSIRGSGDDQYLALYLAGPIRAAGGTEAAMTVLVADYVRQVLNLPAFKATVEETERALEEVELYARMANLQYPVDPESIRFVASRLPIMLTGDPTEEFEVSGSRDLDRIESNRVRGGAVLVLNDGVVGKAAKLSKIVSGMKISGWEWLNELATKISKTSTEEEDFAAKTLEPKSDYLADVIGGRPVFSHPSRVGGFRLRYGRSRNTGLAGVGVHPATMYIVEEFLATGTHIRTERPGKGSIVTPVDSIEGPIVLLKNGSVVRVKNNDEAKMLEGKVEQILYLGDILVALGEFRENNHPLVPSGYCEEWWSHDLDHAVSKITSPELSKRLSKSDMTPEVVNQLIELPLIQTPSASQAVHLSKKLKIPLHPVYLYRWMALNPEEALKLRKWLLTKHSIKDSTMTLPFNSENKRLLEMAAIPHTLSSNKKKIHLSDDSVSILAQLGKKDAKPKGKTSLELMNSVASVRLMDKVGFSIGARMGRPEKAEERRMKPPVQALFPVGRTKGTERRIEEVAKSTEHISTLDSFEEDSVGLEIPETNGIELEMVSRVCPSCSSETFESRCPQCGVHTEVQPWCSHEECGRPVNPNTGMCQYSHDVNLIRVTKKIPIDISSLINRVKTEIGEFEAHGVRGVLGLTSDYKIPEYLGKGFLRAKHDVYCYRDGTARFDATDAPLTHFTPKETGTTISRLHELGYITDQDGEPLISDDQIVELKVQDIVVSENCAIYLVKVGRFIDDCLEKIYGLNRYYRFDAQEDVIGQLVIGLAPHTSAGIIGRIIGFTNASVCYAHPYWHAAKRRNCDGDEDALILVLDALLNFSKSYLPAGRGGLMDAPLVLSVILNPTEVDDESHNIEVCRRYPAEFYNMVVDARHPKEVENLVDIIASRLNSAAQYEGFGFTHSTSSFDAGPKNTRYKILGSMDEKLNAQLKLATLISAVDAKDVAERVLSHHFFRDIRGNLRAYSTQKIQCQKCRRIYRRIPLSGNCICGNKLSLTVRQKNISKYLEVTRKIIEEHGLDQYLQERLKLITASLDSLFISEQTSLTDYFES
ncbi:MAG: DNA polymerase II large subunit [Candidatus Thorarchaeota archaeon AB_25]|nr:MAG: DNA polymerase II large subunit [Candidatus Thorarchaeota archaeon AB_25]